MPDNYFTMLDLAKKTGAIGNLVEENLDRFPEARLFPAQIISGTTFKTLLRVDYPEPSFRAANNVSVTVKSKYESKLAQTFFLDGHMEVDEATVDADDGNVEDILSLEANGLMKGSLRHIGKQVWYGSGSALRGDANGFPGALAITPAGLVLDAGGTTDNTCASVYLALMGEDQASLVFGKGSVFTTNEWMKQRVDRTVNGVTGHLMAWVNNLSGYVGSKWINPNCVGRIKKLTSDVGKGMTDALGAQLMSQFPDGADFSNARWFMTRRSAYQLQISRSSVSNTNTGVRSSKGVDVIAPWPTELMGIPIEITSSLLNTEALAT